MKKQALIHARIESDIKIEAENILSQIGLSGSEAIRLFYKNICLKKGLSFDLLLPQKMQHKVRLPQEVINIMVQSFLDIFLKDDELIIFGSRVHLAKKGGDIDLCIRTNLDNYIEAEERKLIFLCQLKEALGDQKIDIILRLKSQPIQSDIDTVIIKEGVKLL